MLLFVPAAINYGSCSLYMQYSRETEWPWHDLMHCVWGGGKGGAWFGVHSAAAQNASRRADLDSATVDSAQSHKNQSTARQKYDPLTSEPHTFKGSTTPLASSFNC